MFISLKQFVVICFVLLNTVSGTPVGFPGADGRTYVVEINPKFNWMQALLECSRNGAQLVAIDSAKKNDVVTNMLKTKFEIIPNLWLGANDELNTIVSTTRNFYWSATGKKMVYKNWLGINPNNHLSKEHCVHMEPVFQWNDAPCTEQMGFICECVTKECIQWASC